MQRLFKFTKLKLIAGYLVTLLLSAIAIIFIYKQTLSLTGKDNEDLIRQQKIFITSNTLAQLYEAESIGTAFTQTGSQKKFKDYMQLMQTIRQSMDTLKMISKNREQRSRIDTINRLLTHRIQNLKDLMYVKQYTIPEDFYDKALEKIENLNDNTHKNIHTKETISTILDSSYVQQRKKGFFKRLISKSPVDTILKIDTIYYHQTDTRDTRNNADTLTNVIQEAWSKYKEHKQQIDAEIYRREFAVIQSGQNITEQIKRILRSLEDEETSNAILQLEQKQSMTHDLTRTIAWIAIIACLVVILFVFLIINDISQSQRYRKALEEAKAYSEKLLHNREKLMLTVTHDIKSPLSSIIGFIELLNNTKLEERQHYFLKNMKSSAEHILHLANNMLDFSKLESKKMEINPVTYNPGRLLQETVDSFLPLAAEKQLVLKSDISGVLNEHYLGDPIKIRQIVVNILSNAIKYTRVGKINLSAFVPDDPNDTFTIIVKDTGPGMTEQEQELIFKEFTRLTPQHNNGAEGTGLGLTITLQLIHLLGGNLTLSSKKGEGSTFTVQLPLQKATVQESPKIKTQTNTPPVTTEEIKALIVDDDLLQLTVSSELLQKVGITCETCSNPNEAISILEKGKYNLVLSDIQMPEIDGFELVKQIRASQEEKIKNIPVIALSAREDMQEPAYQEAGFSAYLNKPFSPKQLYTRINTLLGCDINVDSHTEDLSNGTTPYDLKMIMIFADNDVSTANQIIQSFIVDCHRNFQLLEEHLNAHEIEPIKKLAHKMLPMFKQFSVSKIVPLLIFLERMDISSTGENKIRETIMEISLAGKALLNLLEQEVNDSKSHP